MLPRETPAIQGVVPLGRQALRRASLPNNAVHNGRSNRGVVHAAIVSDSFTFEHNRCRTICPRAVLMCATFSRSSARTGERARSHLGFRWTGNQFALAIQPVATLLTELLQREVVIKEYRGAAGAPVAIFDRSCLGFGQRTRRIFHVEYPLYSPRTPAHLLGGSCVIRHNVLPQEWTTVQSLRRNGPGGPEASPSDVEICVRIA